MSRKARSSWTLASLLVFTSVLSACSGGSTVEVKSASNSQISQNEQPVKNDPFGKFDAPVTVNLGRVLSSSITFPPGDDANNNVWTRALKDKLNVVYNHAWTVGEAKQYNEKLNVAIAAGSLPDMFEVDAVQLKQLVESDMVADLTGVFNSYKSPDMEKRLNSDGGIGLKAATYDGKLMAIPRVTANIQGANMIWIRQDWLKALNLPEPKTMDDLYKIAKAFKEQDPDKNGKDDTYGIAGYGDLASYNGLFNGFHAYRNIWVEDKSGKLVNSSIQPEMKKALATLQQWYKEGILSKEFSVKQFNQWSEDIVSGRAGITFGSFSIAINPLQTSLTNNPAADWHYYPIVSVDSEKAKPQIESATTKFIVVNKNFKKPEALIKIINFIAEKRWGATSESVYDYDRGFPAYDYGAFAIEGAVKNLDNWRKIKEATETGDQSKLNAEQKGNMQQVQQYLGGDKTMWKIWKIFAPEGSTSLLNTYEKDMANLTMQNKFYGVPTETLIKRQSVLNDLISETYTNIIMGEPIDKFDTMVENWNKIGGDKVTAEVNEWYKTIKK